MSNKCKFKNYLYCIKNCMCIKFDKHAVNNLFVSQIKLLLKTVYKPLYQEFNSMIN